MLRGEVLEQLGELLEGQLDTEDHRDVVSQVERVPAGPVRIVAVDGRERVVVRLAGGGEEVRQSFLAQHRRIVCRLVVSRIERPDPDGRYSPTEGTRMKTVLLTSHTLDARFGTELYVANVARGLADRGWQVAAWSLELGEVAEMMRANGIAVADRLDQLPRPDVIHGNAYFETLLAHLEYPEVPIFGLLHVDSWWLQYPPLVPALGAVGVVGDDCRRAAVEDLGVPESAVEWHPNFADTSRFFARDPLPEKPRRALVFSNYASDDSFVPTVRLACDELELRLDVVGARAQRVTTEPEHLLPTYDIVFAKGRAAIEAMVTGCAVVLCDYPGNGPMVSTENLDSLRRLNFGLQTLTEATNPQRILREVYRYNAADAARVSARMREEASMSAALDRLEATYAALLEGGEGVSQAGSWTDQLEALVARDSDCNRSPFFASGMVALTKRLAR